MAVAGIEKDAVRKRVDLVIAQMELDILAKQLGLVTRTRFINVLEVGLASTDEKEIEEGEAVRTRRRGAEVEFQIPIYDFGEARVRSAEETYMQAVNRLLHRAVNVRAEAREAYQSYRGTWDVAKHYEKEILPLRKIVSDETLLNYNAMITDLFALLTDARARITANVQAIEAQRDFWLSTVDLQTAVIGGRSAEEAPAAPRTATVSGGEAGGH
jgi:outer membrane protein TolC